MDILDGLRLMDTPVNKYKIKCENCKFPDIDNAPTPYLLAKRRIFTGIEIIEADLGNLLVSDRVKRVFEILFPNVCNYQRAFIEDSNTTTNWWLAVPTNTILSGEVKETVLRCRECNQPLYANPGSQYKYWVQDLVSDYDIVKSTNWHSISESDWKETWIAKDVYLSLRLVSLLKKISAKGIYKQMGSKFNGLAKIEKTWIEESLTKIGALKTESSRKELTADDIVKIRTTLQVEKIRDDKIKDFEKKYKRKASELIQVLCSVNKDIELDLGNSERFVVGEMESWEFIPSNKKLVSFARDHFGNSLHFDMTNKLCPIYHYDHETMTFDQVHGSIMDLVDRVE
jgi:hypothetical protein